MCEMGICSMSSINGKASSNSNLLGSTRGDTIIGGAGTQTLNGLAGPCLHLPAEPTLS